MVTALAYDPSVWRQEPDGTLLKALARAWRWQRMLDAGVYATVSEILEETAVAA